MKICVILIYIEIPVPNTARVIPIITQLHPCLYQHGCKRKDCGQMIQIIYGLTLSVMLFVTVKTKSIRCTC